MPRKKADYPDWVMKFKKKGTYINKVGDKYYLYAAHSVRDKETGKVVRVSDGYIGRITREDGLIKSGSSFKSPPSVYEAGMSYAIVSASQNILAGFRKTFPKYGELVFCCSVLSYVYGTFSAELLNRSSLRFLFPGVAFPDTLSPSQKTGIERGTRMISDVLEKTYGDDLEQISRLFPDVRAVQIGKTLYLCGISETVYLISKKYGIDWEGGPWQK